MTSTIKVINKSHFGIYAIILKNNSILLARKSRGPYTGKLDLPGGKPEYGETPVQTLRREVLEETGLIIHKVQLFENYSTVAQQHFDKDNMQENTHHIGMVYLVVTYNDIDLIREMDVEDSLGAQWYELDTLIKENLSPFAFDAITDVKRLNLQPHG